MLRRLIIKKKHTQHEARSTYTRQARLTLAQAQRTLDKLTDTRQDDVEETIYFKNTQDEIRIKYTTY